jgi:hypothetical protein
MQCILTKTAYGFFSSNNLDLFWEYLELFYSGESIPHRTIVSLTCPYCCQSGFIPNTLLIHCLEKHSDNKTSQVG